jgi:transposase
MPLRLSPADYPTLLEVAHSTHDPRQRHRAQALLWLHDGATVDEVATRLCVTPRTVFRWRSRCAARQALALPDRLADGPRSGRPQTVAGRIDALLREVSDDAPHHLGDHATVWTAPL